MPNRPFIEMNPRPGNHYWQKAVSIFAFLAEAANSGIAIQTVGKWIPSIAALENSGFLRSFLPIADPLIYCFRSLIRLTRIIGRSFFHIRFEEEKNGTHPLQTSGDIFSLACFSLSVALFLGAFIAPPIGITLAWTMGLMGLCSVGYFDYHWPASLAKRAHENLLKDADASHMMKQKAGYEWQTKRDSKNLYLALLCGLSLLLICGSAVAFAPPLLASVLFLTSKVASIFLSGLFCGRFFNWCRSLRSPSFEAPELEMTNLSVLPLPQAAVLPQQNLENEAALSVSSATASLSPASAQYPSPKSSSSNDSELDLDSSPPRHKKLENSRPSKNGIFGLQLPSSLRTQAAPALAPTENTLPQHHGYVRSFVKAM